MNLIGDDNIPDERGVCTRGSGLGKKFDRFFLMKKVFFFLLILFISAKFSSSPAQVISPEIYETEEDLKEGLEQGDLTLDEYLELLDLIRSKIDLSTENFSKIIFVPDLSLIDIEEVKGQKKPFFIEDKILAFTEFLKKGEKEWEGDFLCQTKEEFTEKDYLENFCRIRFKGKKGFSFGWEGENSGSKDFLTKRRWVEFSNSKNASHIRYFSKIKVGNFDYKKGLGINLGYHPFFYSDNSSNEKPKNSFIYPTKGRFNGVYLETDFDHFNLDLTFSRNKYGKTTDNLYAFDLNYKYSMNPSDKKLRFGALFSKALLKNSNEIFKDDCLSFYFDLSSKRFNLKSEYANLLNGEGAWAVDFIQKEKKYLTELAFWWYSKDFLHPHSGGISNPDYETIYLLEDFSYRDRRKGEKGILFKSKYYFTSKLFFDFSFTEWRKNQDENEKLKTKFGLGYFFSKKLFSQFHYFLSDEIDLGGKDYQVFSSETKFWFEKKSYVLLRSNLRFKKLEKRTKRYGDFGLKVKTFTLFPFDLTFWLKITDPDFSASGDTYFKLYLQEEIEFFKNYYFSAYFFKKFYRDEKKEDTKGFRLKLLVEL